MKFKKKDIVICNSRFFFTITYGKEYIVEKVVGKNLWLKDDDGEFFIIHQVHSLIRKISKNYKLSGTKFFCSKFSVNSIMIIGKKIIKY